MSKGFITIATGSEEYYQLARNLLHSYRYFCRKPLPFAILCDRENEYTSEFDQKLIFKDGAANSYLDKLRLGDYLPWDKTVFIDADCLAYGDLNSLFDYFKDADEFSCFGRILPLGDKTGWFEYENLGELQSKVNYVVGLHGGIYYMRRGTACKAVFDTAKALIPDYEKYHFKGKFSTPGDEPLIALSMALNGCKPVPFAQEAICCYWEHLDHMTIDVAQGCARVDQESGYAVELIHWGTRYTRALEYKKQVELLEILEDCSADKERQLAKCRKKYDVLMAKEKRRAFVWRVKNKIRRIVIRQ